MIQAKCIEKIRDTNNIITHYKLRDNIGNEIVVTSLQLKEAIVNKSIDIINLRLTKDNKLIDRNIEEQIASYNKLQNSINTDSKTQIKAVMLGASPKLNSNGHVIGGAESQTTVISDTTNIIARSFKSNSACIFKGNKALYGHRPDVRYEIAFQKVTILNTCVMTNLSFEQKSGVIIEAEEIVIAHELIDVKTIDEIFKIIKTTCNLSAIPNKYYMIEYHKAQTLGLDTIYNRTSSILKRQKPSSKSVRRLYDLLVYIKFIGCMFISTNCTDNRYKELAHEYIDEIKKLLTRRNVYGTDDGVHGGGIIHLLESIEYIADLLNIKNDIKLK